MADQESFESFHYVYQVNKKGVQMTYEQDTGCSGLQDHGIILGESLLSEIQFSRVL